jgi:hypothetical protein
VNDVAPSTWLPLATGLRWSARGLSALILLCWSYFIIAHMVGDAGRAARPLNLSDYVIMTTLGLALTGLGVAWKWELAGGLLTLGAILVCALVNWKVLVFPGTLILVTAALFLLSWQVNKTR